MGSHIVGALCSPSPRTQAFPGVGYTATRLPGGKSTDTKTVDDPKPACLSNMVPGPPQIHLDRVSSTGEHQEATMVLGVSMTLDHLVLYHRGSKNTFPWALK